MPIARFQMPDGRIARFEVPQGTTPEQAQVMMEQELANMSQPQQAPTAPTTLRDVGVAGASGVLGAAKSMTDIFGADNAVSKTLGETSAGLQEMYTPERKKEMEYYQQLQDEAAKRGDIMGEVGAAFQGIKAAPLQSGVQALGSLIPNLATLLIPVAGEAKAAAAARGAINTAIGIVQGTGAVKGAMYEGVKQELMKGGMDEATAAKKAEEAQSYFGPNADQILAGAAIGYGTGKFGAEELMSPAIKGAARKAVAVGAEAGTEALQGGQEQVAQNLALSRAGMETPMFQGVAGAATQEGLLGGLGAGPVTLMHSRPTPKAEEPPKQEPPPEGMLQLEGPSPTPLLEGPSPTPLLEGPPPFTPVSLPDGSVATSQADLDEYLKNKREQEVNAPKRPELLNLIDKINARVGAPPEAMPTDSGLSYGTATQEIELLKKKKQTPEIKSRIADLESYKRETDLDYFRNKEVRPSKELQKLREAMEFNADPEARENFVQAGLAEFYRNTRKKNALPKSIYGITDETGKPVVTKTLTPDEIAQSEIDKEIAELTKEAAELAKKHGQLTNPKRKGRTLKGELANKLSASEARDIGPTSPTEFQYLVSNNPKTSLEDMVLSGRLDNYLPVHLRHDMIANDGSLQAEAMQRIRSDLQSGNVRNYKDQRDIRHLGNKISEIDSRIQDLKERKNITLKEETDTAAREAGYLGGPMPESFQEETPSEPTTDAVPAVEPTATPSAEQPTADMQAAVPPAATEEVQAPPAAEAADTTRVNERRSKYMNAAAGESGMSKADVDVAVDRIKSTWENAPDIEVVQSITDLPKEIQDDIAKDNVNPRGVYDPDTKKVWLVADNIPNDAQAAITLAHEALGHFGLRVVLGKNFKQMMSDIYEGNKNVKARADAYINDGMDKATAVEEVLAEMAQEIYDTSVPLEKLRANRTALQKIMNAIRQFLARIGVPIRAIDDAAVLDLIRTARHAVVKGAESGEMAGGKSKYSIGDRAKKAAEAAKAAAHKAGQKRPMDEEAFADLDDELVSRLRETFNPESKTIVNKIDGMKDRFWQRLAQGVVDQYRTIKEYTEEGYMLARMSKTIDGALEGLLFHGQVFLNDGALDIKQKTKGLFDVMAPLGKDVDRYQMWVALNRDADLVRKGKKASIDPELVSKRNKLVQGTINGKPRSEVYEDVQKEMNKLNKSVLDIAYKQGLIDKTAYDIFAADINYIPFYRAMEDGDIQGAATASGLGSQYFSKELEGGVKPFGDLMENTLRNWSHILSASMKNKAAAVTIDAALKPEFNAAKPNLKAGLIWKDGKVCSAKTGEVVGDGKVKAEQTTSGTGAIKVMQNGKAAYYKVTDPLLVDSISSIGYMGPKSQFLDVARDFKNMLQFGVTLSPGFKVRNLFRDSIQAMAVSGLKRDPFGNIVKSWAETDRNNPTHISALAGGGIFNFGSAYEGDQGRLVKKLIKMGVNPDTILNTQEKIKVGLQKAWSAYNDLGNKSEAINRIALYKQLREQGKNHLEASFAARDLMDFSMQGSFHSLRLVTQVVPFLNARLQGLYKLGRDGVLPTSRVLYNSATGKPIEATDKQKAAQFSTVTGAVVMASMMLYLAFKDDDEFKKREEWDRDNFWWFRLPGMDHALRVPKPFEIGAFGTMAERVLEQIVDQGAEGKQFEDSIKRMLSDTFAMNPTPQFIKPLVDLYANKDSFTGAPIETAGMERLSKAERASESTSPLAKAVSAAQRFLAPSSMEMSPVQVDYAIKSYFGWLGGTIAASSHYAVMPFSKGAYPDHDWTDTVSMGFVKSLPATQSKYVTAFYENNKQISQAYADMRHYAELGEMDKVQELLTEKGDMIGLAKAYDHGAKDMAKLRQAITAIQHDETMSGAQKKEEIDRLKVLIGTIAEQLESVRKSMKQ